MATIEWRGLQYPLVLCKRIGNTWEFKCPHCSKSKGQPIYHSHQPFPGHRFAGCEDPTSPFKRTGYITALESPRTREELTKRVARALLNRSPVQLTLDDVNRLTEVLVEAVADPRWGRKPTVAEVMSDIL
jgi:hypothetical protein